MARRGLLVTPKTESDLRRLSEGCVIPVASACPFRLVLYGKPNGTHFFRSPILRQTHMGTLFRSPFCCGYPFFVGFKGETRNTTCLFGSHHSQDTAIFAMARRWLSGQRLQGQSVGEFPFENRPQLKGNGMSSFSGWL